MGMLLSVVGYYLTTSMQPSDMPLEEKGHNLLTDGRFLAVHCHDTRDMLVSDSDTHTNGVLLLGSMVLHVSARMLHGKLGAGFWHATGR